VDSLLAVGLVDSVKPSSQKLFISKPFDILYEIRVTLIGVAKWVVKPIISNVLPL
jgi:hypothetical protein